MTGKELRTALESLGMQQWRFAERFGLTEGAVSRWVQESRPVPRWVPPVIDLLHKEKQLRKTEEGRG